MVYLLMLAGLITITSSWFSIQLASDDRYEKMLDRSESDPGSVTNNEWLWSEDDAGMTALILIVVGAISFIITTGIVLMIMLGMNVMNFFHSWLFFVNCVASIRMCSSCVCLVGLKWAFRTSSPA
jgi:magnesium-transporting ATPase (P-type)